MVRSKGAISTAHYRSLLTALRRGSFMLRGIVVSGLVVLLFLIFITPAFCADGKATDVNGLEALTELLRAKGLISAEEAAAFKGNAGGAEVNAALKPLVELLKNKGILSEAEAS